MALENKYNYVWETNPDFSDVYVDAYTKALGNYGFDQATIDQMTQRAFGRTESPTTPIEDTSTLSRATSAGSLNQVGTDKDVTSPATGALAQSTASDTNNVLTGNILAGASWHSLNPTLADELSQATGQPTLNTAVGGATTADTLQQLNDFTAAGGSFAPGSNVFLQTGGLDLVYGLDKAVIESNIDQIVSALEDQGVNVVLTGSPYAKSFDSVVSNDFDPQLDSIFTNIANRHSNVSLVDVMGSILQNKDLLSDFIHPNTQGWQVYNNGVLNALNTLLGRNTSQTEQG